MSVWANGAWIDAAAPAAPISDRGFALGDGLFETILAEAGAPQHLARHCARLAAGASALGLPPPPGQDEIDALAREALARAGLAAARAAVRVVWTAGRSARGLARDPAAAGALYVSTAPAPRPGTPATLVTSAIRRNESSPTSRWKTLSYLDNVAARREAEAAGADDALMLNTHGRVACAAAATVLAVIDSTLVTPPLSEGAALGVTRARLLDAGCGLVERPISPSDIAAAPALALVNALIGLRPVARLDGRARDTGHPLLRAAAAALVAAP